MLLFPFIFISSLIFSMDPIERDKQQIMRLELATRMSIPGSYGLLMLEQLKEEKLNQLNPEIQPLYRLACDIVSTPFLMGHIQQINQEGQNQLIQFQQIAQDDQESRNNKRKGE